jgi:hypothetical protein
MKTRKHGILIALLKYHKFINTYISPEKNAIYIN